MQHIHKVPPASAPPFVELDAVTIRAHDRLVFEHTSWRVHAGEQWGIVGPNGSGKSLLAAALCGQVTLVRGRVVYHFLSEAEAGDARYGLFPRGSVVRASADDQRSLTERYCGYHQVRWNAGDADDGDTVAELLSLRRIEGINPFQVVDDLIDHDTFSRRREEAIQAVGIAALLGRRVQQLSSGELRKVVLARALMRWPRLLVLDDPFGNLDVGARETVRCALDGLAAKGVQIVIATARVEDLPTCIDRLLFVNDGRVVRATSRSAAPGEGERAEARAGIDSAPWPCSAAYQLVGTGPRAAELVGTGPRAADVAEATELTPTSSDQDAPLVAMRNVSVRYGTTRILDGIDFTVRRGQHWAILGPNGAGKSTLLSLVLADNPQAYANHVELFGQRRGTGDNIWDIKRRIGWVSSEIHAHYPANVRVLDVVCSGPFASIGLYEQCSPEEVARAQNCLQRFAPGADDRRLGELSYGVQRLVLVARAMMGNPDLLVLDEPCQGLDAQGRRAVLEATERAAEEGRATVLLVTHHSDELPPCIQHVLHLRQGRVVQAGPRGTKQ